MKEIHHNINLLNLADHGKRQEKYDFKRSFNININAKSITKWCFLLSNLMFIINDNVKSLKDTINVVFI